MIDSLPLVFDPLNVKDFALGAAIALALRRGRIKAILDKSPLPNRDEQ
jgi:hypothetical protein